MDADLSFDEKEMLKMLDLIDNGYDLVIGSRHMGHGQYESQKFGIKLKKVVSTLGNKYISFVSGVNVHDFSANFRAIKRDVWKAIDTKELNNSILMEMIVKAKYKNFRIAEMPVSFKDRIYGESKLNLKKQTLVFLFKATKLLALRLRLN
jgi:dolichol-phosphate mannosyltransferase